MWGNDWALGIPMLLGLVAFHVCGLVGIEAILQWIERRRTKPRTIKYFLVLMLLTSNSILFLHILEVGAWAYLLLRIDAVDDFSAAVLHSLNAMTTYGHDQVRLTSQWKLLGAIESMNGVMNFGLTTAFLFNAMRELRPVRHA
jgi:hypothetical protein